MAVTPQTDMDIALEMVRRAARREATPWAGPYITTFMGLTAAQIHKLMQFYEEKTGQPAHTIAIDPKGGDHERSATG